MTGITYATFKIRLATLQNWDADTQLLQSDLTFKPKPTSLNLWNIIKLRFTHSRSNHAVAAAATLRSWTRQFKTDLKDDKETLLVIKTVNKKIFNTFVAGNDKSHILRSRSKKNKIHKTFFALKRKYKHEKKYEFKQLNITKSSQIDKFINNFNPTTPQEAAFYFNSLSRHTYRLSRKQANNLLIKSRRIKRNFKDAPSDEIASLIQAHLKLRKKIRGKFFAERLAKNREDLQALLNNYKGPKSSNVYKILVQWQHSLAKNKPIDIPKWYHCTKPQFVNTIIESGRIEVRHQGAFKGAFAATVPEKGYGEYCIALGSNIENQTRKTPLITNVGNENFYIGKKPALKNNKSPIPSIWAGFKKDILLKRPKKANDPLAYYENKNFILLGQSTYYQMNFKAWKNQISKEVKADLKKRKIKILNQNDFDGLVGLINETFHCHFPYSWRNAKDYVNQNLGAYSGAIVQK